MSEYYEFKCTNCGWIEKRYSNCTKCRNCSCRVERIVTPTAEHNLSEILAVIHRDGGHYEGEHGTQKAVEDAIQTVVALSASNAKLREALEKYADPENWKTDDWNIMSVFQAEGGYGNPTKIAEEALRND